MADDTTDKVDVTIRIETAQAGRTRRIVRALIASGLDRVESHARFMIAMAVVSPRSTATQGRGVASVRKTRPIERRPLNSLRFGCR